jgi:hypothetical protein
MLTPKVSLKKKKKKKNAKPLFLDKCEREDFREE